MANTLDIKVEKLSGGVFNIRTDHRILTQKPTVTLEPNSEGEKCYYYPFVGFKVTLKEKGVFNGSITVVDGDYQGSGKFEIRY
ncbi:MAG TPA: hypothetical protein VJI46_01975 [Candidatus Nanoarchaeia archaeon]|nr:hypothetical protein [Candidatus Nanoarchaeia archaeon]